MKIVYLGMRPLKLWQTTSFLSFKPSIKNTFYQSVKNFDGLAKSHYRRSRDLSLKKNMESSILEPKNLQHHTQKKSFSIFSVRLR